MNDGLTKMYPYAYIYKSKKRILIWQTGGNDTFRLDSEKRLISAPTIEALKDSLGEDAHNVEWSEEAELNFDKFWTSLRNMRPARSSSERTCDLLLNGWNFIEDLGRTFGFDTELEELRTPILNNAYQKLFYGNNLPSITPEDRSYYPLWTDEEMLALRKAFKKVWNFFQTKGIVAGQKTPKPPSDASVNPPIQPVQP